MTYDYDYWLKRVQEIDVIVIGEGERTFKHLLDVLCWRKITLQEVQGIAYRTTNIENYCTWSKNRLT